MQNPFWISTATACFKALYLIRLQAPLSVSKNQLTALHQHSALLQKYMKNNYN